MATPSKPPCLTCGNSEEWHEHNPQTVHRFNDGSASTSATFGTPRNRNDRRDSRVPQRPAGIPEMAPVRHWPHDPVLRLALIDAGVITPDHLRRAEEKIQSITQEVMQDGQFEGGQEGLRVQPPTQGVPGVA